MRYLRQAIYAGCIIVSNTAQPSQVAYDGAYTAPPERRRQVALCI